MFEVRAERSEGRSRWSWAIYRPGATRPLRRSVPIFSSDADALEAGGQVVTELQRRATRPSYVKPGV